MELIRTGGTVFVIIVAAGAAAFVLFLTRAFDLHRARIRVDDFLHGITTILGRDNVAEAVSICEETPGPVAAIVKTAILHRDAGREGIRDAILDSGRTEIARMEQRMGLIGTVAQTAPLLGLLGTVIGMIRALFVMQQKGALIQSADIMGWLLQALVTTAAGLTVAIPCYAAYNYLAGRIERLVLDMEQAASGIVAFLAGGAAPPHEAPGQRPGRGAS